LGQYIDKELTKMSWKERSDDWDLDVSDKELDEIEELIGEPSQEVKHKYIKRIGSPGNYRYHYYGPTGSSSKDPEKQFEPKDAWKNMIEFLPQPQKRQWKMMQKRTKEMKIGQLNEQEKKQVIASYGDDFPKMKECFKNAQILSQRNPNITYVEGVYIFKGFPMPFPHAWNKINGKYFDPTQQLNDKWTSGIAYFGKEFSSSEVRENIVFNEQYTSVLNTQIKKEILGTK